MYREFKPPEVLRPYVKCFWHLDRTYASDQQPEVVWPHASVEIIFHFADRYVAPLSTQAMPHAFVIGPLTRFVPLRSPGRVRLVGARCYPWGFARLFGGPLRELRDVLLPFEDVAPSTTRRLTERLSEASPHEAVQQLSRYLTCQLRKADGEHAGIVRHLAPRLLTQRATALSLARHASLSLRQLQRQFDDYVGVSPKQLIRIVRFNAARERLISAPSHNVLQVAFACGYTDYSHMTRDFRQFIGSSPVTLRRWALAMDSAKEDVAFLQDRAAV